MDMLGEAVRYIFAEGSAGRAWGGRGAVVGTAGGCGWGIWGH